MRRGNGGFTLIEVLVALALAAMIFGVLYGTYAASDDSVRLCRGQVSRQQQARALLALIAREVRCGYLPAGQQGEAPAQGAKEPLPRQERPSLAEELAAAPGHALVLMTAGSIPRAHDLSYGLDAVAYRLDAESATLYRRQAPAVDVPDAAAGPATWHVVARGVRGLTLEALDGDQWRPGWTGRAEAAQFPRAVRISVAMGESGRPVAVYSTVVYAGWREREKEEREVPVRAAGPVLERREGRAL